MNQQGAFFIYIKNILKDPSNIMMQVMGIDIDKFQNQVYN